MANQSNQVQTTQVQTMQVQSNHVIVTYLEMTKAPPPLTQPSHHVLSSASSHLDAPLSIHLVSPPDPRFFRYLYKLVGEDYHWHDLDHIDDKTILKRFNAPDHHLFYLSMGGAPTGLIELDYKDKYAPNLTLFGLARPAIGKGIGKALLDWAIDRLWYHSPHQIMPKKITVDTCTADHPSALPLYKSKGFTPYDTKTRPRARPIDSKENKNHDGKISFQQFLDVDIRLGTITKAERFKEARNPAYKLWIDFGDEIGMRKSSAQITQHYEIDALIGRQICAVVNFPEKQIGPFMSQCLVLGFADEKGYISLISPDHIAPNGAKLC